MATTPLQLPRTGRPIGQGGSFRRVIAEVLADELPNPQSPMRHAVQDIIREELAWLAGFMRVNSEQQVQGLGMHPQHIANLAATAKYGVAGAIITAYPDHDPYPQESE